MNKPSGHSPNIRPRESHLHDWASLCKATLKPCLLVGPTEGSILLPFRWKTGMLTARLYSGLEGSAGSSVRQTATSAAVCDNEVELGLRVNHTKFRFIFGTLRLLICIRCQLLHNLSGIIIDNQKSLTKSLPTHFIIINSLVGV